jgi:ERCC4-type nuclease
MIKIDFREKDLFKECENFKEKYSKITFEYANLYLGDIQIDKIIIERKTLNDLAASIKDGRYTEQSFRLKESIKEGYRVYYFIEGNISTYSGNTISKETLISTIYSLTNKGFYVINTLSVRESSLFLLQFTDKMMRDAEKNNKNNDKNKSIYETTIEQTYEECSVTKQKNKNITKANISIYMLCQIPTINTTSATILMNHFKHINILIKELNDNPECLNQFTYEKEGKKRKLRKNIIQNLRDYLVYINPSVNTPGLPCV